MVDLPDLTGEKGIYMFIRNKKELEDAYIFLRYWESQAKTNINPEFKKLYELMIIKYKKDIRAYYNRFSASENTYLVYANETGDGYVEKVKLPILGNYTKKEVEELFEENYFIQCPNSPWDCTGRPFTSRFCVYKNSYGEWWAYHSISLDV